MKKRNVEITLVRHFTVNPRVILFGGVLMDVAIASIWALMSMGVKKLKSNKKA